MHPVNDDYIVRYTHPSRFDFEPYGSIWKAFGDNDEYTLYIQVSEDPSEPKWITIGNFFEVSCREFIGESYFILACLKLYKLNEMKSLQEEVKKLN